MESVSASFHQNVFLLSQLVPPSNDFKKVFREGMFDKPNMAGFVEVTHYLLIIYDAERFKKQIEWPIVCKKMEAKYRNDVKDYLTLIATENPDMEFPNILVSYFHHASGPKFIIIMWKLSQLVLKRYIMNKSQYQVMSLPKLGFTSDLSKIYLQQSKANIADNIMSRHKNFIQIEKAANVALEEQKEQMAKIKTELFNRKQSIEKYAAEAPVDFSLKQRLMNIEDSEIIQMWKDSIQKHIYYIQKRNILLKELEKACENVSTIISNLSNGIKVLDGKQPEEINRISEMPLPPDIEHCLYHLYNDNKLVYHNFIRLFTLILHQVYQRLRKAGLKDLSQCLLQVEASVEDMKSMYNVFQAFLTNLMNSTKESQSVLCGKNMEQMSKKNALPFVKGVLFMPSPPIKINTDCDVNDARSDSLKLLQITPENGHKLLFSRYARHNQSHVPNLRTNLFVSRINIDNTVLFDNNEKQGLNMRFATPKINRSLIKKPARKYSRLFSTFMNKNLRATSSMLSLPTTAQASSSDFKNTIEKISFSITERSYFNLSEEYLTTSCTSEQLSPIKAYILSDASQQQEKDEIKFELKANKFELNEFTEVCLANDENKSAVLEHKDTSRRRSISDLVERFKKLKKIKEVSDTATINLQNECAEHENE